MELCKRPFTLILFAGLIFVSCKPLELSADLSDKKARKLYDQALHGKNALGVQHNADSTFALCSSRPVDSDDGIISFFILDLEKGEVNKLAVKCCHSVAWLNAGEILIMPRRGIIREEKDLREPAAQTLTKVYNLHTKKISEYKPNQERR